jgi:hypothetical protein
LEGGGEEWYGRHCFLDAGGFVFCLVGSALFAWLGLVLFLGGLRVRFYRSFS